MEHLFRTLLDSPVGHIELTGNQENIISLYFLDEDERVPTAGQEHPAVMDEAIRQLNEYFEGKRKEFSFPFHQPGKAFQQKVWELLLDIPYGKTISYSELSKRYGNPRAVRAVGSANGRNALSVIVPCHRVIGSDGRLVGYGGGLWRKQWLLKHEARYALGVQSLF